MLTFTRFDYTIMVSWDTEQYTAAGFVVKQDAIDHAKHLRAKHGRWQVTILDLDGNIVPMI